MDTQFASQERELESGFGDPLGASYSPQVKEAIIRSGKERLGQQKAQAYREGQYDVNRLGYGRDLAVAGMTAPVLTQTSSSSSGSNTGQGTVAQSQSPFSTALQVAGAAAPLSL